VPGCPSKPEAIIDGVVMTLENFKPQKKLRDKIHA